MWSMRADADEKSDDGVRLWSRGCGVTWYVSKRAAAAVTVASAAGSVDGRCIIFYQMRGVDRCGLQLMSRRHVRDMCAAVGLGFPVAFSNGKLLIGHVQHALIIRSL